MAKKWSIQPQIIDDPVSELVFEFYIDSDNRMRFRIYGDIPNKNRDFIFDSTGKEAGAGTSFIGFCGRPKSG